ncbi:MAG: ABC transporter ATP-binding protein [Fusobacteriaceae bacterium]
MLKIIGIDKYFEGFQIENFNFEISRHEFVSLLGESGSGKTTILRLASGLDENYSGKILINNHPVKKSLELGEISVVFQDPLLLNHLNLEDNIKFGLKFRKIPETEINSRVCESIKILELDGLDQKFPVELSGGQKQRVSIARALVTNPKILFMDEPFSALDAPLRERLQIKIKEIQKKLRLTILFVTHDRDEAFAISDRVAIIQKGELIQMNTPKNLYENPKNNYVSEFLKIKNIHEHEGAYYKKLNWS